MSNSELSDTQIIVAIVVMCLLFLCIAAAAIWTNQPPEPTPANIAETIHVTIVSQGENNVIEAEFDSNTTLKAGTKYIIIFDGLEK